MATKVEDRPSICTTQCDWPDCANKEVSEAYPEAKPVQKIPNNWYLVDINKIEIPSKFSQTGLPGQLMTFCPIHGDLLFKRKTNYG